MTAKTLRTWYLVHKWTSLISTIFLLMLCLTGLPLIFHEEIEHYFEPHPQLEPLTAESPRIDYDDVIARAWPPGRAKWCASWYSKRTTRWAW
ncbi:putative iron-regulated membrane protein [Pseudomonas aeruginosa PA38182]|nr:putative iron-regulated membrane protein [Pseudomonas aeruginosa PA38182]